MNIFKEMALSIYSYKTYPKFLNNKKGKVFAFGVVLMLLYFTVTTIVPFVKFLAVDGGIGKQLEEFIPDFELKDDYLWVEDVIEYEVDDIYLYIDTDPEYVFYSADEMAEYLYGYSSVILMDSEKMIVKSDGIVEELYYAEWGEDFSKEDFMGIVPYIYMFIVIGMIIAYLTMTAIFFFSVLFVALLGMIAASCMKCKLTFGQLYLLGIYSRTFPMLIKAILSLLSLDFFMYTFISIGISLVIVVCAIQKIKEEQSQEPLDYVSGNYIDNDRTDYFR